MPLTRLTLLHKSMYSKEILELIKEGSHAFSLKDFDQATSKYADACASFNEEHGKDCPDLLFLYGRALFQSGVSKAGVLGSVTAQKETSKKDTEAENDEVNFEEGLAKDEFEVAPEKDEEEDDSGSQIETGEEAGDDDNDGADDSDGEAAPEEEQSDFEAAWDILDLSRALFEERVSQLEESSTDLTFPLIKNENEEPKNDYVASLKMLSATYDLLGEVSLESENFPQAAADFASCLKLRLKLYDSNTSCLISEIHYKLSLALEFCQDDPSLRNKAAEHMKLAIESVKERNKIETDEEKQKENEQLLAELDDRYEELKKDPEQELRDQQMNIIKGILGEATSDSSKQTKIAPAVQKKVNDLSSMVKKRKAQPGGPGKKQKKA